MQARPIIDRSVGYSVREIVTPKDQLVYWSLDEVETQKAAIEQAAQAKITYLPIKSNGKIVGIARREGQDIIEQHSLMAEWLIAADTPILHLIALFAQNADRVFLVLQSSEIIGLVAPSDLNKIPARASIYLLTAQFEDLLANLIREKLEHEESNLQALLSPENFRKISDERSRANEEDVSLNLFHYLYFADLHTIAAKHSDCREHLGFKSRKQAQQAFDFMAELRNRVSHLTGLLITSRTDLASIDRACETMIHLCAKITSPEQQNNS
ncbi:MAG: hypothetical protein IPO91_32010 [Chloroflexi bacterium]|nr:hypothetical protein [Chloroflexota bacterium]